MARIGPADDCERGCAAVFDDARIEPRDFRGAAHVEVEIPTPELLNTLDRLAGLEAGLDHREVLPVIGAFPLAIVDDGGQIGMKRQIGRYVGGPRRWARRERRYRHDRDR